MTKEKYKLSHINPKEIEAAARKALIAADASYYSWTAEQQEQFRANQSSDKKRRIDKVLLKSLLDIKCSLVEIDAIWNDLSFEQLNKLNWARLLTSGIGDDFIDLNEGMEKDKSLLDFTTLYDYDYADYQFQEKAYKRDIPDYQGSDYYAWKHPSWVRLLIDNRFYYATFTSLATWITDEVEIAGREIINELIPHQYIEGDNHGKPEGKGFLWDMQVNANGLEGELDELNNQWYLYLQSCWIKLSQHYHHSEPAVYVKDHDWDDDPHRFFIFNNASTLKQIRWRHFLSDCKPLIEGFDDINARLKLEIDIATIWLQESLEEIMENFDPKVVKLKKRRKIVLSADVMDGLNSLGLDDEPDE